MRQVIACYLFVLLVLPAVVLGADAKCKKDGACASHVIQSPDVLFIEAARVVPKQGACTQCTQPIIGEHLVTPDGTVNLGSHGKVNVAGCTVKEAAQAINQHLGKNLENPQVTVTLLAYITDEDSDSPCCDKAACQKAACSGAKTACSAGNCCESGNCNKGNCNKIDAAVAIVENACVKKACATNACAKAACAGSACAKTACASCPSATACAKTACPSACDKTECPATACATAACAKTACASCPSALASGKAACPSASPLPTEKVKSACAGGCSSATACAKTACPSACDQTECPATACASACPAATAWRAKRAAPAACACSSSQAACSCSAVACPSCKCDPCQCCSDTVVVSDDATSECCVDKKIEHLTKAYEHLSAAGNHETADQVLAQVQTLRRNLLAEKLAELSRLNAEIAQLRGNDNRSRQVLLQVKVVEVSLTRMKELGFAFASCDADDCDSACAKACEGGPCPAACKKGSCGTKSSTPTLVRAEGVEHFLDALVEEGVAKVLAMPNVVTASGRPASYTSGGEFAVPVVEQDASVHYEFRHFGTRLDAFVMLEDDDRVHVEVRPSVSQLDPSLDIHVQGAVIPGLRIHEVHTGLDMALGQTAVIGGAVESRTSGACDDLVHEEVQTLFLVTPSLVESPLSVPAPVTANAPGETHAK